ncbi:MAG: methionyl-tRNA formyltransferase, partial [Cyanobium sp.]
PIQWALLEGDSETGVGSMAMEEGLDTGTVLLERRLPIGLLENAGQLGARLSALTAELLVEALPRIEAAGPGPQAERWARLALRPQPPEGVTHARLLTRDDSRIDWNTPALALHRRIMGLHPGAHARWQGRRLKLLASEPLVLRLADQLSGEGRCLADRWGGSEAAAPGAVLEVVRNVGLVVATAGCPLLLRAAQLEGRPAAEGERMLQQLGAQQGDALENGG